MSKKKADKAYLTEISDKHLDPDARSTASFRMIRDEYIHLNETRLEDRTDLQQALHDRKMEVFRLWSVELYYKALQDQGMIVDWMTAMELAGHKRPRRER